MVERLKNEVPIGDWLKIGTLVLAALLYVVQNRTELQQNKIVSETIRDAVVELKENVSRNTDDIVSIKIQQAEERGRVEALAKAAEKDHDKK
jgi:hypothetical protein